MISIFGPSYKYNGEVLTEPEIILVQDHHYNEQQHEFTLKSLLENSKCNPQEHVVIFDHVLQHNDQLNNYNLIFLPSFLAKECQEFNQQQIKTNWVNKTTTFNFMINKPRPHRELLLQLIKLFNLTDYSHSLAWQVNLINDIPVTNYLFGSEQILSQGIKSGNILNSQNYQGLLQTTVFEPSCISLITEPAFFERETIITEKTIMALWGGTIPIWVGGWRIPAYLKTLRFDLFDDIVDHSYQDIENPWDRCYQAINLNLELLKDPIRAQTMIKQCLPRLVKNLELLKENIFQTVCQKTIDQHTGHINAILRQIARLTEDK
jgi:hypothetical protein